LQLSSGQHAVPTVQCCSAKQAHSRQCVTAVTPVEICSSYIDAVTQHQCIAALLRARCSPHCSVLVCKTGSQQPLCHCKYTYGDMLFTHVCSDPAPMHCSSVQGKMQSPLFCAALQNRLTAALCHCSYTYRDMLFTHVCSDPAPMHCSSVQGKMQSPLFSAALQNRLTAATVPLQIHLLRFALHPFVQ